MANIENSRLNLLEHQEEAYEEVENLFKDGKYAAVIFPTGSGKTFVPLEYILEHPDDRILFLAPRCAIKEQMYEYVTRFIGGIDDSAEDIIQKYGSMENAAQTFIPNIKCMLYQSILGIGEKESVDEVISKLNPDLIVVDEMHHLKTRRNLSKNYIEDDENTLTAKERYEIQKDENEWGRKFKQLLDMYPKAKVLGLSATPIRMDGANVVERIFENSIASEISLLEAMEQEIIIPPKYVVPDFLKKEELNTLLEQIELAEGEKKARLKDEYDRLVEESENAPGIPELLDENITQRDGKYIIFCKDIKDMEEKQAKAQEWFGKIDKEPTVYRVSSKHSDSKEQLNAFNNDESDHLKLMYCVGMIDEGVHLNNVSGVILATKTESRISYLQRLGRTISTGDDKKRALLIDLVNNNEILLKDMKKDIEYGFEITDLEALAKLVEWIDEKNDGKNPSYDAPKSNKEKTMAKRMVRLNHKYLKYNENEKLLENLDDDKRKEVKEILALGRDIRLWDEYIEIEDEGKLINSFLKDIEVKGVRKDFIELLRKIERSSLSNALEIEKWCQENYGDKKIWERKLPTSHSKDEYERKLGQKLTDIRRKIKQYDGKEIENIENEKDRQIVQIIRKLDEEYGLCDLLKNALEIEEWCKVRYGDKKIWERKLPSMTAKDEYEKKLGQRLYSIRRNRTKQYDGKEIEEIENEEDRRIVEMIRRLDEEYGLGDLLKNALEIEEWCKINNGDKKIWERKLPNSKAKEDEYEKKLGQKLADIRRKIKQYDGKEIREIENEEDRRSVEIIRRLDEKYGLGDSLKNALEIEEWCKINNRDKKIWERRLPISTGKDKYERILGQKLIVIRKKIKQYDGKEIREIENEEDRRSVEIIRRLDEEYGLGDLLKNALEIEEWCKINNRDKKIWERSLPSKTRIIKGNEYERKLGQKLSHIRLKIEQYTRKEVKDIENEEDRQIVEIIRRLDKEYGLCDSLKNALEIEEWCKANYGDKKIWERKLPYMTAKDEYERTLGKRLKTIRAQRIKQYDGKEIEEIENEEDRQIVKIIRRLDKEYGLCGSLKNALEIEEWCKTNYGDKKIWERKLPSITEKDEYERNLGQKLNSIKRNRTKQYDGKGIEDIENEEDRQIVEIIRRLDKEYGLCDSLKNALEIEEWCKTNYGDKKIWERKLPNLKAKEDEYERTLGIKLATIRTRRIKQYDGKEIGDIENEEDRQIVEIIRRLDKEYGLDKKTKKEMQEKYLSGQDIGQASFEAPTQECDKADRFMKAISQEKRIGE